MLLTAANGTLAEQNEYDAFGRPYFFNAAGQAQTASNYGNRFLFTGREYLPELKLYDYRNRMYQPELGRFLQPDPVQFAAGDYNLYRYCHNDPVNTSDPTGLRKLTMEGGGDWVTGSDGLSAWDREVGGMPSNRWQAAENGSAGGGPANGSSPHKQTRNKQDRFPPVDPKAVLNAAQKYQRDIENAVRGSQLTPEGIEYGSEVNETPEGALETTKMHQGNGTTSVPGENRMAQNTTVSNTRGDRLMVGYIVGYAHYSSKETRRDVMEAAKIPNIAAAVFVGYYKGGPVAVQYVRGEPLPKIPGLGYPY